jgi:hypothetical protein
VSGDASGTVAAETVYATDKLASTLKVQNCDTTEESFFSFKTLRQHFRDTSLNA